MYSSHNNVSRVASAQRCKPSIAAAASNGRKLKYITTPLRQEPELVELSDHNATSEAWRLEPVVDLLRKGAVGIIPTDSLPALVADVENKDAVARLYAIKGANPKKKLSILCRNLSDISYYTSGFPTAVVPGEADVFSRVKKILPGPYTFILPASKNLPKVVVDPVRGTSKHRGTVGVRWPSNSLCQYILDSLGHPLLSTSVHVDAQHQLSDDTEVPDTGTLLEMYGNRGVDFVVGVPPYVATVSTVIDMTGSVPDVVRYGLGDASMFE